MFKVEIYYYSGNDNWQETFEFPDFFHAYLFAIGGKLNDAADSCCIYIVNNNKCRRITGDEIIA